MTPPRAFGRDIVVAGPLDPARLRLRARPPQRPDIAHIDLTSATFVTPYGLVFIAVQAELARLQDRTPVVTAPDDDNVARYLARMDLGIVIEELGGQHDLPVVRHHEVGDRLLELQRVSDASMADALAGNVHDRLIEADAETASAMHQSICEIGQNVFQHSGRPHGYLTAQSYEDSRVAFAIGDSGVGLRRSLAEARPFDTDLAAIDGVLRGGVSSTGRPGRGHGISRTLQLISGRGGELTVHSGGAARLISADGRYRKRERALQGTLLHGEVTTA